MNIKIAGSKIVVADDSTTIRKKLELYLNAQGYQVFSARDGKDCLDLIEEINPDLVILDLDMPVVNGLDVCKALKTNEKTNLIPVIILTSSSSEKDKHLAISIGANDYLNKSSDNLELRLKVESLLKLKNAINQLENANNIIKSLAKAVEVKDLYTEGHAERVSLYATKLARNITLNEQQIKDITMAGLLHDIGKIGIPDHILNKPGKLTDQEYEIIKQHPVIGEEICSPIKSFDKVKKIIRSHHEKLNGSGYPDKLKGADIDIETRIMTIADIYDALTSDRAYRKSMDDKMVYEIMDDMVFREELDGYLLKEFKLVHSF